MEKAFHGLRPAGDNGVSQLKSRILEADFVIVGFQAIVRVREEVKTVK